MVRTLALTMRVQSRKSVIAGLNRPGCWESFRKARVLEQKPTRKVFQAGRYDDVDKTGALGMLRVGFPAYSGFYIEHGGIPHALGVGCETMGTGKVFGLNNRIRPFLRILWSTVPEKGVEADLWKHICLGPPRIYSSLCSPAQGQ